MVEARAWELVYPDDGQAAYFRHRWYSRHYTPGYSPVFVAVFSPDGIEIITLWQAPRAYEPQPAELDVG